MNKKYLQTKTGKEHTEFVRSHQEALKEPRPTEGKPSPLPWRRTSGQRDSEFDFIMGGKCSVICEIDISHPDQDANADFIVKAVNLHAKLIEALEAMQERMKLINGPDEKCVIREWKECGNHKIIHEVEALLKEAKGGTK